MVRLFSGGYSTILAVIAAFFATLYVYDADPETWKTEISGTYSHSPQVLFQFLTDPKNILQYFKFISSLHEEKPSQKLEVGKIYVAAINVPLVGKKQETLRVTHLDNNIQIVLQANDPLASYFFRPVFHIAVYPVCEEEEGMVQCSKTNVRFSLWFNRRSILFQYTLAPMLNFFASQQFQQALLTIKWMLPPV